VLKDEDDLRETISAGRTGKAAATSPRHRRIRPFNSTTNTVEWRLSAMASLRHIQRWHIADNDDPDKTAGRNQADAGGDAAAPGAVCHSLCRCEGNPDANEVARKARGRSTRGFTCGQTSEGDGCKRRAVELTLPLAAPTSA